MKILFVTSSYFPTINGVCVSIRNFKKGLEALGHEVWVLAPAHRGYCETETHVMRYPSIYNPFIKAYPIPLPVLTPKLFSFLRHNRFNIVHTHHPFYVGTFARVLSLLYRCPLVFTHHTRYDAPFSQALDNSVSKTFIRRVVDYFCHQADIVVAPSPLIASYLERRKIDINVSVVASPLSDFSQEGYTMPDVVRAIKQDQASVVCVMANRLTREKNTRIGIEAKQYVPSQYHAVIVGDGPERKALERLAAACGVADRVHFVGAVSHEELSRFYSHADVFLFGSTTETQSMSVLEAAYFGLPIVAIDSEFSRAVIPDKVGIRTQLSPALFAQAIMRAYKNTKRISARGRAWAGEFTREKQAAAMASEYEKALAIRKCLRTGWQSWSTAHRIGLFASPHLYNPLRKDNYAISVTDINRVLQKSRAPIAGWNSWAAFGPRIDEEKILRQVDWIRGHTRDIPLEYVVIDDGWTVWGDWMMPDTKKFPAGLKSVVDRIHASGLQAGIWMAPFCARGFSYMAKQFPSWCVYDKHGLPIDAAQFHPLVRYAFSQQCSARLLDVRQDAVWNYIKQSIDFLLRTCEFDFIKLDFLFAPYFIPGIKIREASGAIRRVFSYIRQTYPNVFINACGCPLVDAIGCVDAMRVGPDVIMPYGEGKRLASSIVHAARVSTAVRVIKNRAWTRAFWLLDPDIFACRPELGIREKDLQKFRRSISECKGLVFLGDDLPALSQDLIDRYIRPLLDAQKTNV